MKFTLGYSPCPNDTFIFDALVNNKIDREGLEFDVILEDVETLNQWAFEGRLDITKLSYPAFFQNPDKYILLDSGAASGKGVGPVLIAKEKINNKNLKDYSVAIPGVNTTANLLLNFAYPEINKKVPMLFSEIEEAVLSGKTDLGVIIHENRFTYRQKGLHKVTDLGEAWSDKTSLGEGKMKLPVPLGGIVVRRSLDLLLSKKTESLIRKSIEFAFSNLPLIPNYVKNHAQEMNEEVMRQHIDLYVNNFSVQLGEAGKKAILTLYKLFKSQQPSTGSFHSSSQLFLI
ncbi:MAG TPA: 1,4-dihydroxy-6-naphthoate synthase [Chitinophagaceae bacterium]|nr:1,4-dihydroxy-6-naphthoate synthase [Chitinophagaceae bacterium]